MSGFTKRGIAAAYTPLMQDITLRSHTHDTAIINTRHRCYTYIPALGHQFCAIDNHSHVGSKRGGRVSSNIVLNNQPNKCNRRTGSTSRNAIVNTVVSRVPLRDTTVFICRQQAYEAYTGHSKFHLKTKWQLNLIPKPNGNSPCIGI